MSQFRASSEDHASIAAWFDEWGSYVASCDFEQARTLFSPTVVGFGTYMDLVEGLDALEARQWRSIWPTIADFRFLTDNLRVWTSPDRCLATAMLMWSSTGFSPNGDPFSRPGRTTAVLHRARADEPWRCEHTHFSEFPAERQRSFGQQDG
tara:strand:- start:87 stop:539 length:453 start_codon:yes stop_codon:yes gene_type:complete